MAVSASFDPATGTVSGAWDDFKVSAAIPGVQDAPSHLAHAAGAWFARMLRDACAMSKDVEEKLRAKGIDPDKRRQEKLVATANLIERGDYEYGPKASGDGADAISTAVLVRALQILRRASIAAGRKPEGSDAEDIVRAEYQALPANKPDAVKRGLPENTPTRASIRNGAAFQAAVVRARAELGIAEAEESGF